MRGSATGAVHVASLREAGRDIPPGGARPTITHLDVARPHDGASAAKEKGLRSARGPLRRGANRAPHQAGFDRAAGEAHYSTPMTAEASQDAGDSSTTAPDPTAPPPVAPPGPAAPAPGGAAAPAPGARVAPALAGLYAGAAGGVLAALVDFALGVGRTGQFLPGPMGRVTLALFLLGLYGFFGALVGVLVGALGMLLGRGSDLGALWGAAWRRLHDRRRDDPAAGLHLTAWAVVAPLVLGGATLLVFAAALTTIVRYHHPGLIAAVIGIAAVGVTLAAVLVAFPLQRAILRILRAVCRGRAGRAVGSPFGAAVAFFLCAGLPLPLIAALTWNTTRLLPFRPFVIAFVYLAGLVLAWSWGGRRRGRGGLRLALRPLWRRGLAVVLLAALFALAVLAGRFEQVRKAASSYAALATPLMVALRAGVDLDRDGYAAILGGNDCDDLDADVNPGAFDWPDDGLDQNCNGADATVKRSRPPPFAAVPDSVPRDLNFLLVTVDTVRADHYGCYGYARNTSPTTDALAREGALFVHGMAHAPSTRYSMPAIITGRMPSRIAWGTAWWPNILPENPRIPVALKKLGYYTAAILNYRYFDPIRQFNIGFDHYDNSNARLHHGTYAPATHGTSSREQTDAAIKLVDEMRQVPGRKFFLWIHYYDPHWFYEPHPDDPTTDFTGGRRPTGTRPGDLVDLYDGEIRFTENQFQRLIAHLKETGLYDRTAIIIVGDHGEGFGEHGIDHHGYHLYNAQTKVPFVVRVPGLRPQRPVEPVGHIDIAPTILNLARAAPEPRFQGHSFVDLLTTGTGPRRHIFQEVMYEGPTTRKTVVSRDWKLIYNVIPDQTFELYHLSVDPGELHDLYGRPAVAAETATLKRELLGWMEEEHVGENWHERVDPAVRRRGQPRFTPQHPVAGRGPRRHLVPRVAAAPARALEALRAPGGPRVPDRRPRPGGGAPPPGAPLPRHGGGRPAADPPQALPPPGPLHDLPRRLLRARAPRGFGRRRRLRAPAAGDGDLHRHPVRGAPPGSAPPGPRGPGPGAAAARRRPWRGTMAEPPGATHASRLGRHPRPRLRPRTRARRLRRPGQSRSALRPRASLSPGAGLWPRGALPPRRRGRSGRRRRDRRRAGGRPRRRRLRHELRQRLLHRRGGLRRRPLPPRPGPLRRRR
jgi:arylsulfatase A-like enzyme